MANFKAGVSNGGVSGDSNFMPSDQGWTGTFWSGGWGASEATPSDGKGVGMMPKMKGNGAAPKGSGRTTAGGMKQNMGSKHGKCAFCG